jgi:hypothetical protein
MTSVVTYKKKVINLITPVKYTKPRVGKTRTLDTAEVAWNQVSGKICLWSGHNRQAPPIGIRLINGLTIVMEHVRNIGPQVVGR